MWRQGKRVGHHVYEVGSGDDEEHDRWVGSFVDPEDARRAVEAYNKREKK